MLGGNTLKILGYWSQCMKAQDLSARTIEERIHFIERADAGAGPILTVTRADLVLWTASQEWSNKTRVHYRSLLHTFFTWLQDEGFRADNPAARLPKVKARRREPNPFTVQEIDALLASGIYYRTRVMVALHYYVGLRVSEIAAVHGRDVDWNRRTLTTIGKGSKKVTLPIPDALWQVIQGMPRDAYWFPNAKPNRYYAAGEGHILGRSVSTLIGNAIRRAGMTHRPHELRAATATEMNRAGVSAFVVQRGMRHTSMDTTNHYLLVDLEQVREGLDQLPPVEVPARSGRRMAKSAYGSVASLAALLAGSDAVAAMISAIGSAAA